MIAAVINRPTSGNTTGRTGSEQSVRLPLRRSSGVRLAALWACLVGSGLAALGADIYVLREVRGASGWLRGHSGRHTSLSYDPQALRDRLLGLHSRRALSLPTSPTTCIVRTGAVSARGGRPRPTEGR